MLLPVTADVVSVITEGLLFAIYQANQSNQLWKENKKRDANRKREGKSRGTERMKRREYIEKDIIESKFLKT